MKNKVKNFKPDPKRAEARKKKLKKKGYFGKTKSGKNRSAKSAQKKRKKARARRSNSGGGSITKQISSYKDEAIGGGIFGVISKTKIPDIINVSANPAAREVVGAAIAHFAADFGPTGAKKYLKDAAKAGVSYAAILLTKNSEIGGKVAENVDPLLPAQPLNDTPLLGD